MLSFPVSIEKQKQLILKMKKLGVKESDLEEKFTRANKNGGQNVNKVSTAVFLKHKESGIEIKCKIYRTQGLNRYKARDLLCQKLEEKLNPSANKIREKIIKNKIKNQKKYSKKMEELRLKDLDYGEE